VASYIVTISPSNDTFEVKSNEIILEAAINHGISIAYSCRNGTCRTCIFQILEGQVKQEDPEVCFISPQELEINRRLVCMSTCSTNVVMEKASPKRQRNKEEVRP
jgi:ferredoxin